MSRLRTRRRFVENTISPVAAALGRISGPNAVIVSDSTPPTVPTNLQTLELGATSVYFGWTDSTDSGSGLGGYRIYLNGANVPHGETDGVALFLIEDLTTGVEVSIRVSAFDNQGNESAQSAPLLVTPAAWGTVPNVSFTQGVAGSFDFSSYAPAGSSNYIFGTAGQTNVPNTARIAELAVIGVTLDVANRRIVYSGAGPDGSYSSNLLEDVEGTAADWQSRISGPGVVWFHNFDSAAEVNRFRWTGNAAGYSSGGNDPNAAGPGSNLISHVASGGADGGGFLRATYPLGSGSYAGNSYWWRPFNALTGATNGRGTNDPGANGTITAAAFNVTQGSSTLSDWGENASNPGWYMNASHQAAHAGRFQGSDFYLQVRVRRAQRPGPPPDGGGFSNITGKNVWITTTESSYTTQEIVTYGQSAGEDVVGQYGRHRMYGGNNYSPFGGSQSNETCSINNSDSAGDWRYSGGWDTLLYHVTPGPNNGTGANRTRLEVWAAQQGVTTYTKIWDTLYTQPYDGGSGSGAERPGWNALILGCYHNGAVFATESFNFDYDQVIFSKETIACPQA